MFYTLQQRLLRNLPHTCSSTLFTCRTLWSQKDNTSFLNILVLFFYPFTCEISLVSISLVLEVIIYTPWHYTYFRFHLIFTTYSLVYMWQPSLVCHWAQRGWVSERGSKRVREWVTKLPSACLFNECQLLYSPLWTGSFSGLITATWCSTMVLWISPWLDIT